MGLLRAFLHCIIHTAMFLCLSGLHCLAKQFSRCITKANDCDYATSHNIISEQGNGALQAPSLALIAWWTHLVSAQLIWCSRGISIYMMTQSHESLQGYPHASIRTPLSANTMSSTKPKVHKILQHCQKRTKPRPRVTCTKTSMKIGCVVPEICSQTGTQTIRHPYLNTVLTYWEWSNNNMDLKSFILYKLQRRNCLLHVNQQ